MFGRQQLSPQHTAAPRLHHSHACGLRHLQSVCHRRARGCATAAVAPQSQQALLNEELKNARSAEHLLRLLQDNGKHLNAVNVFTATTRAHHYVRVAHDASCQHISSPQRRHATGPAPLSSRSAHTAAINSTAAAELLNGRTSVNCDVVDELVGELVALSQPRVSCMSAKHCVSILTAYAWIHQMRPTTVAAQWRALVGALCDRLVAQAGAARPADLSRAVWACARLSVVHDGLSDAASLHLRAAAAVVSSTAFTSNTDATRHVHVAAPATAAAGDACGHMHAELPAPAWHSVAQRRRAEVLLSQAYLLNTAQPAFSGAARTANGAAHTASDAAHTAHTAQRVSPEAALLMQVLHGLADGGSGLLSCLPVSDAAALVVIATQQTRQLLASSPDSTACGTENHERSVRELVPGVAAAVCAWLAACNHTSSHAQHTSPPPASPVVPLSLEWLANLGWAVNYLCRVTPVSPADTQNLGSPAQRPLHAEGALSALASMANAALRSPSAVPHSKVGLMALQLARAHRWLLGREGVVLGPRQLGSLNAAQQGPGVGQQNSICVPEVQQFMAAAAELTTHHASAFTLQTILDLSSALSVYAAQSSPSLAAHFTHAGVRLATAAAKYAPQMPADELIQLAGSLVGVGVVPEGLVTTLEARVVLAARQADAELPLLVPSVLQRDPVAGDEVEILDDAMPRCDLIDDVSPRDVAKLCGVLAKCRRITPEATWSALAEQLEEAASVHAPDMDNQSLVACISGLASLGHACSDLLDEVTSLVARNSPVPSTPPHSPRGTRRPPLSTQQLALGLWATARVLSGPQALLRGMGPITLFRRAAPLLAHTLGDLTDQGLALVAYAYVSAEVHPGEVLLTALQTETITRLPSLHPRSASLVIWALTHYKACDPRLILRVADLLTAAPASHPTHAMPTPTGQPHDRTKGPTEAEALEYTAAPVGVMTDASGGPVAQYDAIRVDVLVGLCVSLAKSRVRHPPLFDLAFTRLVTELRGPHDTHGGAPWLRSVACLVWAAASLGYRCHTADIDLMLTRVEEALGQVGPRAVRVRRGRAEARLLSMLLQALPGLRYQPSAALLSAVCARVAQQIQQLSTHTLCEVIWAFAALQYTPSKDVLDRFMCAVEQRVVTDQQEILTLPSTVKLAWALACFSQYRHPLTRHVVVKVLSCPPTALIDRPAYLRMLLEVQRLVATEGRSGGFWRAVSRHWQARKDGGAPEALPVNLAGQGYGSAVNAAMARMVDTLPSLLSSIGYPHAAWQATPQGELTCTFVAAHSPRLPAHLSHLTPLSPTPPILDLQAPSHSLQARKVASRVDMSRVAVYVLCPWHLSVNVVAGAPGPAMRSNAAVHVRLLRRKGFSVAMVTLEEILGGADAGQAHCETANNALSQPQGIRAWQQRVLAARLQAALKD